MVLTIKNGWFIIAIPICSEVSFTLHAGIKPASRRSLAQLARHAHLAFVAWRGLRFRPRRTPRRPTTGAGDGHGDVGAMSLGEMEKRAVRFTVDLQKSVK